MKIMVNDRHLNKVKRRVYEIWYKTKTKKLPKLESQHFLYGVTKEHRKHSTRIQTLLESYVFHLRITGINFPVSIDSWLSG